MAETPSLLQLITVLRSRTDKDSVTPENVGYILELLRGQTENISTGLAGLAGDALRVSQERTAPQSADHVDLKTSTGSGMVTLFQLGPAGSTYAGVMTGADKAALEGLKLNALRVDQNRTAPQSADHVDLKTSTGSGTVTLFQLGPATTRAAGVMTGEDKAALDTAAEQAANAVTGVFFRAVNDKLDPEGNARAIIAGHLGKQPGDIAEGMYLGINKPGLATSTPNYIPLAEAGGSHGLMSNADKWLLTILENASVGLQVVSSASSLQFQRRLPKKMTDTSASVADSVILRGADSDNAGLMTASDKGRLDTLYGQHGGSSGLLVRESASEVQIGHAGSSIIIPAATEDAAGCMSKYDKQKLENLGSVASGDHLMSQNDYEHFQQLWDFYGGTSTQADEDTYDEMFMNWHTALTDGVLDPMSQQISTLESSVSTLGTRVTTLGTRVDGVTTWANNVATFISTGYLNGETTLPDLIQQVRDRSDANLDIALTSDVANALFYSTTGNAESDKSILGIDNPAEGVYLRLLTKQGSRKAVAQLPMAQTNGQGGIITQNDWQHFDNGGNAVYNIYADHNTDSVAIRTMRYNGGQCGAAPTLAAATTTAAGVMSAADKTLLESLAGQVAALTARLEALEGAND